MMIVIKNMKKVLCITLLALFSSQALAISEGYRQQLQKSGCTQMTDGNGCDIHKSKAENAAAAKKAVKHKFSLGQISSEVDSVIGKRSNVADEYLFNQGWRLSGDHEYTKAGWKMRTVVDPKQDYKVVNAQIIGNE